MAINKGSIPWNKGLKGVVKPNLGSFQKGHIPWNKGLKGYIGANKTSFKKGNIPVQTRPVFSERVGKDNYLYIKYAKGNKWKAKHVWIYEQYHCIKVPKGYVVIFKDGDKRNFSIENLVMISRKEHAIVNRLGGAKQPVKIKDSYILYAKLKKTIKEAQ